MGNYRVNPKQQFSKWLARFGAIVWGIYIFAIIALIAYRPETSMACVWLTLIVTANKELDTVSYTKNSTTEKIILGALERTQLELGLNGYAKSVSGEKKQEDTGNEEDNLSEGGAG